MMHRAFTAAVAILALVGFGQNVQAQLYKWVDDAGDVHYSDQKPDDKTKSSVVPVEDSPFTSSKKTSNEPIVRPHDSGMRKLLVMDALYLWKSASHINSKTKIGSYHTGGACTSRGSIMAPRVFAHHKNILPSGYQLSFRSSMVINSLDYDSQRDNMSNLEQKLTRTRGNILQPTIVEMVLKTCATSTNTKDRLKPVENVPSNRFTRNRVQMKVKWELRSNKDQSLMYQTVTTGNYNGWELRASSIIAIGHAMESATKELLSDNEFVSTILIDPGDVAMAAETTAARDRGDDEESVIEGAISWLSDKWTGDADKEDTKPASPKISVKKQTRESLASTVSTLNIVKMSAIEHYVTKGHWPQTLSQLQVSDYVVSKENNAIDNVEFYDDGRIVARLSDKVGSSKYIMLTPEDLDRETVMANWSCISNLDSINLPRGCVGE